MTLQYLAGELSLLLGELQLVAPDRSSSGAVGCLRREAETRPITALTSVAVRALVLTDGLCWESLGRADAEMFVRQAAIGAELHEFGVCAGLLDDD